MAELSNGARWQDNVERTLERLMEHSEKTGETVAGISLQLAVVQQKLDGIDKLSKRVGDLEANDQKQDKFLDRIKWGLGIATAVIAAAWGLTTKWVERQLGL